MTFGKNGLLMATSAIALMFGSPVVAAGNMSESEMQSGSPSQAAELVGTDIRTSSGEDIGSVESVIYDSDGDVAAVIVDVQSEYDSGYDSEYLDDPLEENTGAGEDTGRNEPDD